MTSSGFKTKGEETRSAKIESYITRMAEAAYPLESKCLITIKENKNKLLKTIEASADPWDACVGVIILLEAFSPRLMTLPEYLEHLCQVVKEGFHSSAT